MVKFFLPLRMLLLKIGRHLHKKGLLGVPEDIFLLKVNELEALGKKGSFSIELSEAIKARKQDYAKYEEMEMPAVIDDLDNIQIAPDIIECPGDFNLKGIAASYGKVEGIARVILSVDEIEKVQPGDILVTDHTDPGWTPIFAVIKGLVTNTGGLISHASIVAREYGLPAVVNIPKPPKS